MNNFNGKIPELPNISVDKFVSEVLDCTAFFLSHFHTDHMEGLRDQTFYDRLMSKPDIYLYCSEITYCFIESDKWLRRFISKVKSLPMDEEHLLKIPSTKDDSTPSELVVTLLSAGHCPGSVMFHFTNPSSKILYTGDFRLQLQHWKAFSVLHDDSGNVKPLTTLYLDTTFCNRRAMYFPQRHESLEVILEKVEEWIRCGDDHSVFIECAGNFGGEYIFVAIHEKTGMKVHVSQKKMDQCQNVVDLVDHLTTDSSATRVHSCYRKSDVQSSYLPCDREKSQKIRVIRVTAMWFQNKAEKKDIVEYDDDGRIRVCYSMHSSCDEIIDAVTYLRPSNVHPLVLPNENPNEVDEILDKVVHGEKLSDSQSSSIGEIILNAIKRPAIMEYSPSKDFGMSSSEDEASKKMPAGFSNSQASTISDPSPQSSQEVKWTFEFSPSPNNLAKNSPSVREGVYCKKSLIEKFDEVDTVQINNSVGRQARDSDSDECAVVSPVKDSGEHCLPPEEAESSQTAEQDVSLCSTESFVSVNGASKRPYSDDSGSSPHKKAKYDSEEQLHLSSDSEEECIEISSDSEHLSSVHSDEVLFLHDSKESELPK